MQKNKTVKCKDCIFLKRNLRCKKFKDVILARNEEGWCIDFKKKKPKYKQLLNKINKQNDKIKLLDDLVEQSVSKAELVNSEKQIDNLRHLVYKFNDDLEKVKEHVFLPDSKEESNDGFLDWLKNEQRKLSSTEEFETKRLIAKIINKYLIN